VLIIAAGATPGAVWLWADYHFHAAQRDFDHHRIAEARAHLRLCLKAWPESAPAHFLAGRAARRAQDFRHAKKHFQECERLQGWSPPRFTEQALMRVQQGEMENAEQHFLREIEKGDPDSPLYLEALVEGYMHLHRLPDAAACLQRWEKLQPDNMYLYFLRGSLRERIPNLRDAADDYRKVLELNPGYEEARLRLARVLIETHDSEEALTHLAHLRSVQPENPSVLVLLARCYMDLARPQEAREVLAPVLERDPRNQPALLVSARLALQEGDLEQAENQSRRAVAADPSDREAHFLLSQSLLRQPSKQAEAKEQLVRFKRVEADWQTLHEITTKKLGAAPHDPDLMYQLGVLWLRLGDEKEGVEWLKNALRADPSHQPSRKALADYYRRVGDSRQVATQRPAAAGTEVGGPR
jgi:tetratricopeptide (TPR) repeat protein